ncbi:MAG: diguanylate cyclase, partial [Micromonosporaceae bacterium]|nr:diguanylate cyclase [Micromonosporaceae bacterium]
MSGLTPTPDPQAPCTGANDVTEAKHDGVTNRRLHVLVGLVVVSGLGCVFTAVYKVASGPPSDGLIPLLMALLIAAANVSSVRIRVRASTVDISAVSSTVLVAATIEPMGWLILSAVAGTIASLIVHRIPPMKITYNAAKEAIAGAAVCIVLLLLNAPPQDPTTLRGTLNHHLIILPVAAIAYALVEEALIFSVIAAATGTSIRERFVEHWDVRLMSRLGALVLAGVGAVIITVDSWLLVALPLLLYALHLASTSRVRSREERAAWQRLAQTTDEMNSVDLDGVLRGAVLRAAELFSADEAEVEISW